MNRNQRAIQRYRQRKHRVIIAGLEQDLEQVNYEISQIEIKTEQGNK